MYPALQKLDLNLLPVLDALLELRSVSRAAERLCLTQPAVSNALARLRLLMDDPLLVKTRSRMEPTPAALRLILPVRQALADIEQALHHARSFNPQEAKADIRVAMGDHAAEIYLPGLAEQLGRRAPGVVLGARYLPVMPVEVPLACSDNHFVLSRLPVESEAIRCVPLLSEPHKLLARKDHPLIRGPITLDSYCALPHAIAYLVSANARNPVDDLLAALGKRRRIAIKISMPTPIVSPETDFVATQPASMAEKLAAQRGLAVHDLPFELPPSELFLLWHRKYEDSALHAWLRDEVIEHFKAFPQRPASAD